MFKRKSIGSDLKSQGKKLRNGFRKEFKLHVPFPDSFASPYSWGKQQWFAPLSLSESERTVKGAHDIPVVADKLLNDCPSLQFDMIVLPGGMPGSENLAKSPGLIAVLKKHYNNKACIAAICAAPAVVLHPHGFLNDEQVACYPTFLERLNEINRSSKKINVDGQLITAAGPGGAG